MRGDGALLGIDLGTTAVKVVANSLDGRELAEARRRYALATPRPEWVEQDPDEIYRATMDALQEVLAEVKMRGEQPLGVGFSAAMHGLLAVDARDQPLSPLITWMDRRSAGIAERWRADGTAARLYERTGAPMHPMLPLCKLRWLAEHEPGLFKSATRFVGMKELFISRWTGEWLIDHALGTATGMLDTTTRAWDPEALALAGLGPERLSKPVPCSTARTVNREVASALGIDARTPVVLASSDGAAANLGIGAIRSDTLALTLGTSGALRVMVEAPKLDAQGRTFCYPFDDTRWLVGGPTSSAGAVLEWIFALLAPEVKAGSRFERAVTLAQEVAPGSGELTVLPFLSGERAPYWRADLRGEIAGLDLAHDRRHLLRAAFEGVVFALYAVQGVMAESLGESRAVLLSGGITRAPFIRQMIADVFGMETRLPDRAEASAFGAAMFAGLATGSLPSLEHVAELISYPARHTPDPAVRGAYDEAFARYERAVQALLSTGSTPGNR